mgnify:CR=1 FL=1
MNNSIKKQIIATLSVVGLSNRIVTAEQLIGLLDGIFNMDFTSTDTSKKKWNS